MADLGARADDGPATAGEQEQPGSEGPRQEDTQRDSSRSHKSGKEKRSSR